MAVVTIDDIAALGRPIELEVPADGSSVTPASRVCVEAIARHGKLLAGKGIDWGSGSGCLAIAAARLDAVDRSSESRFQPMPLSLPTATQRATASTIS